MMIVSGDADTSCNPLHARKMTARLPDGNEFPLSDHSRLQHISRTFTGASFERTDRSLDRSYGVSFRPAKAAGVSEEDRPMSILFLKAYGKLIFFDLYLARGNFAALYEQSVDARSEIGQAFWKRPHGFVLPSTWPAFGTGNKCSACSDPQRRRACSGNTASVPRW